MGEIIKNDGFSFSRSFNGGLTLQKDGAVNANFGMYSSSIQLQGKSSAYTYSCFGFSQYFLKRKLALNVSISNPFTGKRKYISNYSSSDFKSHSEYLYQSRSLRVSLSYNFGKMDIPVRKARHGISSNDIKSGGSSNKFIRDYFYLCSTINN